MSDLTSMAASQAAEKFYDLYSATAYIGAGDGDTAFDVSQTDLQGTNTARVACSSVTRSGDAITFTATFDANTGNFEWLELAVHDAASAGNMLVRKVLTGVGTKPASQQWEVEAVVTFAAAT